MSAAASSEEPAIVRRVTKSLVQEMTEAEKDEFNALPVLEIEDMEQVNYLHTIAEGWAFPLERFMNEQEFIESMNMNTITDKNGKKHILSVPITHNITAAQKE
jgi:ATP sulfurylase